MSSQLPRWTGRRRLVGAIVILLAVACIGSVGTALATSGGDPQPAAMVATVMGLDGHEYPAVVARVNGEEISGKVLAQRVYGIEHAGPGAPPVADPVQAALNGLIQDAVLRQAATARGITVTAADIQADQQYEQNLFAKAGPTAQQMLQAEATFQGDKSIAEYWSDPTTIAVERDVLLIGKMREQIIQQLPQDQRRDVAAQHQAIAQFVAAQHSQVETFIQP